MSDPKKDLHKKTETSKSKTQAKRATRKTIKRKGNYKPGPGRPKGSTISPTTGLTPNQEEIAQMMLEAELDSGLFPSTVREVCDVTGKDPATIRKLLKRDEFQKYLFGLLALEGVVLEGAFWRSLALGLQAGDPKVLDLYAKMTGKIQPTKKETKMTIEVTSPDGQLALPKYEVSEEGNIIDIEESS